MSLYHEAADILQAPTSSGGSLKARIFSNKSLKSQPSQLYALVIESCKWSHVLKEVIENAGILVLEKKLTPIISLLLVHDLLLAKKGIALPSGHGLRMSVERHKARLQAELTKARIRRGKGSMDALKEAVESGEAAAAGENDLSASSAEPLHPRWVRINTLKTQLEDQLETTFAGYELVQTVEAVGRRGPGSKSLKRLHIDQHIPNLVAISPNTDLTKTPAYIDGSLIIQDKASCFPAYLLDPLPQDGDIMDTCAAPGNKTTHLAAILRSHIHDPEDTSQTIHAFEKDKRRAETLEKMVTVAGAAPYIKIHAGQDFLKVDPNDPAYENVTALLLDPSCSGSGIIGRDDMPTLHLPEIKPAPTISSSTKSKNKSKPKPTRDDPPKKQQPSSLKRKAPHSNSEPTTATPSLLPILDDDLNPTTAQPGNATELATRLQALSSFQLSLLTHAFAFPAARKITYSTCSIHFEENESVVLRALRSQVAKERGWRVLSRAEQVRGMREWDVRGDLKACCEWDEEQTGKDLDADVDVDVEEIAEACIRANKADAVRGTMGFFVAGFVREESGEMVKEREAKVEAEFVRDEKGRIVRDLLGMPVKVSDVGDDEGGEEEDQDEAEDEDEWNGFDDDGDDEVEDEDTVEANHPEETTTSKRRKR